MVPPTFRMGLSLPVTLVWIISHRHPEITVTSIVPHDQDQRFIVSVFLDPDMLTIHVKLSHVLRIALHVDIHGYKLITAGPPGLLRPASCSM